MCGSKHALLSQYFGYQVVNSGTVDTAARVAAQNTRPIYTPTNPFRFRPELGFSGFRYAADARRVIGPFMRPGYDGILPVKEQPRVEAPWPYNVPVVV